MNEKGEGEKLIHITDKQERERETEEVLSLGSSLIIKEGNRVFIKRVGWVVRTLWLSLNEGKANCAGQVVTQITPPVCFTVGSPY